MRISPDIYLDVNICMRLCETLTKYFLTPDLIIVLKHLHRICLTSFVSESAKLDDGDRETIAQRLKDDVVCGGLG